MENKLNVIYDDGFGFVIESCGLQVNSENLANADWVSQQLTNTEKAALDPEYPALTQVLEYRAALRAYRDNNFEGDRPLLEV